MRTRELIICSLGFWLAATGRPEAAGATGAEFLRIDVPASTAALAAGTAVQGGSALLAWNPAGILGQQEPSLSLTHVSSFIDTAYEQLEGVYPQWLGGSWALRLFYGSTYDFMEINEYGDEVGELENYDVLLHFAHARNVWGGIQAGLAVKAFESVLAGYNSHGLALDAGVQYHLAALPLSLGIALQNLGAMTAFEEEADPLPLLFRAGAASRWQPLPGHGLNLRLDAWQPLAGDDDTVLVAGLEYTMQELLAVRAGYRFLAELGGLSLGAGVRVDAFGLDYAYQPFNGLGDNHRLTFTYYFQAGRTPPASVRGLQMQEPGQDESALPIALTHAARQQAKIKTLTVLPRKYEGKLLFKTPEMKRRPKEWRFEINNQEGRIIKTFSGPGRPPANISWDGRDENGNVVMQKDRYELAFHAAGHKSVRRALPQLETALKLSFKDGAPLEPAVRFIVASNPEVTQWRLAIRQQQEGKIVRVLEGRGLLPAEIMWDGCHEDQTVADTRLHYTYELAVAFADESEALVSDIIQPIPARQVPVPDGDKALLLTGVLFDFNSAILAPEMTDKCIAAAEIMRRYPRQAKAVCEGHADEIGTEKANIVISEERAHMVANFLAAQPGVHQDSLSFIGYGKSRPENTLRTEEGRARNRRVEIRLLLPAP
ncbi:OmpA family protein [candidate division FCPU426 bacterium]|nr:OmpA family protein [candidate division FCPU426 bacterium]